MLTGFQIPAPAPEKLNMLSSHRTTRKIAISPYVPVKDVPYDHRTCIYMLAASMHHVLTNHAPPHYPAFPPVRTLNPLVSPELQPILTRAFMQVREPSNQSYPMLQQDLKRLL